jgi:hypothetical protein
MPDNGWIWSFEQRIASDTLEGREVVARILEALTRAQWAEHDAGQRHQAR